MLGVVEQQIEAEPFGDLQVKGLTRPVTAYKVRRLRGQAAAG